MLTVAMRRGSEEGGDREGDCGGFDGGKRERQESHTVAIVINVKFVCTAFSKMFSCPEGSAARR